MESYDKNVVLPEPDAPVTSVSSPLRKPPSVLLKKLKYCDLTPNSSSACMIRFMSLSFMSEIVRIELTKGLRTLDYFSEIITTK
jgi:hypothetical protein